MTASRPLALPFDPDLFSPGLQIRSERCWMYPMANFKVSTCTEIGKIITGCKSELVRP